MVSRVKLILELYHSICCRPEPSASIAQGGQFQLLFASSVFEGEIVSDCGAFANEFVVLLAYAGTMLSKC